VHKTAAKAKANSVKNAGR